MRQGGADVGFLPDWPAKSYNSTGARRKIGRQVGDNLRRQQAVFFGRQRRAPRQHFCPQGFSPFLMRLTSAACRVILKDSIHDWQCSI
ncbi:MAG: hypothetical protein H6R18_2390 [Proteobacteria bacterium]|nr:hypothetical protein [Pseudomonadota bacterium]